MSNETHAEIPAEVNSSPSTEPAAADEEKPSTLCEWTAKILEADQDPVMKIYREQDEIDTDSDTDESDIVIQSAALEEEPNEEDPKTRKFGPTAKGELTLDDLPPVEKLQITVPLDHLKHMGNIYSFVDRLVVVEASSGDPVLNLETVLFLEDGRAVGQIFDVIGPVIKPYYVLRFNNHQEIEDEHLEKGVKLFCAPSHADYTFFVFEKQIKEMMKLRGSDASWEHDLEPPEHELEYSDDEQEREAKKERRVKRQANGYPIDTESSRPPTRREFFTPRTPHPYFNVPRAPPGPSGAPGPSGPSGPPPSLQAYPVPPAPFHPGVPPPGYNPWAHPGMSFAPVNYAIPPPPYAYPQPYPAPYGVPNVTPHSAPVHYSVYQTKR